MTEAEWGYMKISLWYDVYACVTLRHIMFSNVAVSIDTVDRWINKLQRSNRRSQQ